MVMRKAVLFPGQGSQSVGMLSDFHERFAEVRETFAAAAAVLGYDLWQVTQAGPADKLNQSSVTQPAILTASVALWRVLKRHTAVTDDVQYLAGHSLGEYSALVCAEALNFEDAVELVAKRGALMQQATPLGVAGMAAVIGLSVTQLNELCSQVARGDEVLQIANYNSPQQTVLAGHTTALERAAGVAKQMGAKRYVVLPVTVASHSPLMQPAASALAPQLSAVAWQTPKIPVIHNVDLGLHQTSEAMAAALIKQLTAPVRWVESIQKMAQAGVSEFFECGPGVVLTGLNKRIVPEMRTVALGSKATLVDALDQEAQT